METTFPGTVEPTSYSAMGFLSFLLPRPPFLMLVFFSAVASSVLTCYQRRLLLPTLADGTAQTEWSLWLARS